MGGKREIHASPQTESKTRMDTSAIIYRVADFLKAHPPFNAMDEPDLLEFASRGRVRFHEAHDYVLWQGQPNQFKVFVIQQGTVSLWVDAYSLESSEPAVCG